MFSFFKKPRLMVKVGMFYVNRTRVIEVIEGEDTLTINFDTGKSEVIKFENREELVAALETLSK